jgi:hypothetical protein
VRVIEKGWQRAKQLEPGQLNAGQLRNERRPVHD